MDRAWKRRTDKEIRLRYQRMTTSARENIKIPKDDYKRQERKSEGRREGRK